jgi:hypothetical protein
MSLIAGKNSSYNGSTTFYADSVADLPTEGAEKYDVGDVVICRADGGEGIVTYMLFPSGWWKVG